MKWVFDNNLKYEISGDYNHTLFVPDPSGDPALLNGKTFDEIYELSRRDCWFNSDESKEIGLIDNIIGLEKDKSITNYLEGFEEYYAKEVFKS
jgi:hypothetical protein